MKPTDFKHEEGEGYALADFGFKIHLSATLQNYKQLLARVLPYLRSKKLTFKYLKTDECIFFNLSDAEDPAESGKLVTIYPKDRQHCLDLLEELYQLIGPAEKGVYILSDRPYKNSSVIFYRYGCIQFNKEYLVQGVLTLTNPNGEQWQDFQKTYFDLPSWIEDLQAPPVFPASYLGDTYQVTEVLHQSNGGNVYKAYHLRLKKWVVIKECRPYIACTKTQDKQSLREHEWNLSATLQAPMPSRIEKVQEWIHHYYIYDYVEGVDLADFCNELNLFAYRRQTPAENLAKFQTLLRCFKELLTTIATFHSQGIILHDIHPNNLIVTADFQVVFVDLEHAYYDKNQPLTPIYSEIALAEWNELDGKRADCHKVGNLLLYLIGKLHRKPYRQSVRSLEKLLLQKQLKSNIATLIQFLFSDEATMDEALKLLENQIVAKVVPIDYHFNLQEIPASDDSESLYHMIAYQQSFLQNYQSVLNDERKVLQMLQAEKTLGLDGAAGALFYLKAIHYDQQVLEKGVDWLLTALSETEDGLKGVAISDTAVSPYLIDGTAGIIHLLLAVNHEKYVKTACQIGEILKVEYAQFANLEKGMLGIALTLVRLFHATQHVQYLQPARELLISSSILVQEQPSLRRELLYVLSQYKKATEQVAQEKLGENDEIIYSKSCI